MSGGATKSRQMALDFCGLIFLLYSMYDGTNGRTYELFLTGDAEIRKGEVI